MSFRLRPRKAGVGVRSAQTRTLRRDQSLRLVLLEPDVSSALSEMFIHFGSRFAGQSLTLCASFRLASALLLLLSGRYVGTPVAKGGKMRSRVKTRPARRVERDVAEPTRRPRVPPGVRPPARFDEDGEPTLEGFRSDERLMVREYGD